MAEKARSKKVITPEGRLSFPHLFEARGYEGSAEKYSTALLFPPGTDLSEMKKAANEAAKIQKASWPAKRPYNPRNPFRDATEKAHLDGYEEGWTVVSFSSKRRPGVVAPDKTPVTDENVAHAGRWARVSCVAFAYDVKGNHGVSFALNNVQLVPAKGREDSPFGSASRAEDDFDEIEDIDGDGDGDEIAPGDEDELFK